MTSRSARKLLQNDWVIKKLCMNGYLLTGICLTLMITLFLLRRKLYFVPMIKIIPMAACVAGMGLLGTYILYFLENGIWYGKSFFGAVLFFPLLLLPVAWIFRMKLVALLSYSTIPGLFLLAVYKWNCYTQGCCGGKVLWFSEAGIPVHFPSQLAEMCSAAIIALILLFLERKPTYQKIIYPLCLVIYGAMRCVLNYFRWDQPVFLFGLTPGAFWSVVSIAIGSIWLFVYKIHDH